MKIIAIDIRLLGKKRTGDEAVFFNLTKELLALGRGDTYLLLTHEHDEEKLALLRASLGSVGKENVVFVSLLGTNRFVWNAITLPWFFLRNTVDIFHTQYILPLWIQKSVRVVNHIHDVSFRAYPELIGWKDRLFLGLLIPRSLSRADRVIVPSFFTKQEVIKYYGLSAEKVAVIPNAIGSDFSQDKDITRGEEVRTKYQLPKRYLLSVGTLQPRKNIPFLIRAFAELRKRQSDISLVLVGNRSGHHYDADIDRALMECQVEERVIFPGYVAQHDIPVVIGGAELFVFPSLYEGFGIPLLEAMSQGVPVAASDIPCLREVAGEAAQYFDPSDVASCSEKMYTLLVNEEKRHNGILEGRNRVSLFSWKKSAETLERVYDALI